MTVDFRCDLPILRLERLAGLATYAATAIDPQPCTPHRLPARYARRRPEQTPLYRIVTRHLETWLAERSLDEHPVAVHVEEELRSYLRSRLLSFGFVRARCGTCGHDFLVAFSCKGRGVCPSCNGRRMAQTAGYLVDHVIPPVPVRQWVISVPKRLRWFLAERPGAAAALTTIWASDAWAWPPWP